MKKKIQRQIVIHNSRTILIIFFTSHFTQKHISKRLQIKLYNFYLAKVNYRNSDNIE